MPAPISIQTHILNVYHSRPPKGKKRWTNADIAERLMRDRVVNRISKDKVRRVLLKCLPCKNEVNIDKWRIKLDEQTRQEIDKVLRSDKSALQIKNRVLELVILHIYRSPPPKGKARWSASDIAQKLLRDKVTDKISEKKVGKILMGKLPSRIYNVEMKIETLVGIIYLSPPPNGKIRWSCQSIADKLISDKAVRAISREKVRRILKKCFPDEACSEAWRIKLDDEARRKITKVLKTKRTHSEVKKLARILLDLDSSGGKKPDIYATIFKKRNTYAQVIMALKKRFVEGGVEQALYMDCRKHRISREELKRHVLAILKSPPPKGKARWSCREIAEKLVRDGVDDDISYARVWRILKNTQ